MTATDVHERFWSKVDVGLCWEWSAGLTPAGYGKFWQGGKTRLAHRVSWELLVGEIPDGLPLDHLCRNICCVNPDHLEPVSTAENTARSSNRQALAAQKAAVTHCSNGHSYADHSVIDHRGTRLCIPCRTARRERHRDRRGFTITP
ncbi:HNH endonuclease signature motif containing protein [Streptomyces sp. NPDC017979]|uniref:HNH endonuclease signature motif containing protein n=1 Tax=Streptomyces sp. NPDC017979 TaxID=3365024 RepID=UPI0037A0F1C3